MFLFYFMSHVSEGILVLRCYVGVFSLFFLVRGIFVLRVAERGAVLVHLLIHVISLAVGLFL